MKLEILSEYGYEESALGFSLSYNSTIKRAKEIMPKYAFGIPGENKFLESIYLWLDVIAPRFWWSEADTYRLTTKQSQSTMHTILKQPLEQSNFEYPIVDDYLSILNDEIKNCIELDIFKGDLPEGFLQRRIWVMNYKCLQNIYNQRYNHKLPQWKYFCEEILKQIEHPEFIVKDYHVD